MLSNDRISFDRRPEALDCIVDRSILCTCLQLGIPYDGDWLLRYTVHLLYLQRLSMEIDTMLMQFCDSSWFVAATAGWSAVLVALAISYDGDWCDIVVGRSQYDTRLQHCINGEWLMSIVNDGNWACNIVWRRSIRYCYSYRTTEIIMILYL